LRWFSYFPKIPEMPSKYPCCAQNCVRENLIVSSSSQLEPKQERIQEKRLPGGKLKMLNSPYQLRYRISLIVDAWKSHRRWRLTPCLRSPPGGSSGIQNSLGSKIWTLEGKSFNLVSGVALFNRHVLHFSTAAHKQFHLNFPCQ